MKIIHVVACSTALSVGVILGSAFGDEEVKATTPVTAGERLRDLWTDEGWERLEAKVSATAQSLFFRHAWQKLMFEELGVTWPSTWKDDKAAAMGVGRLHRYPDGVECETRLPGGAWEPVSGESFDCYVHDGNKLRRVVSDESAGQIDTCVLVFLPDRLLLIDPKGRVLMCPRRPAGAAK